MRAIYYTVEGGYRQLLATTYGKLWYSTNHL